MKIAFRFAWLAMIGAALSLRWAHRKKKRSIMFLRTSEVSANYLPQRFRMSSGRMGWQDSRR